MTAKIAVKNIQGRFTRFKGETSTSGTPRETLRSLPDDLGQGQFFNLYCRQGMDLCMSHCRFSRDYRARITLEKPRVTFAFCMSGTTRTQYQSGQKTFETHEGHAHVFYTQDPVVDRIADKGRHLKAVVVHFSPLLFSSLLCPEKDFSQKIALAPVLEKGRFSNTAKMDSAMHSVAFQMFACPHQGAVRRIYLESKAMELVALSLSQTFDNRRPDHSGAIRNQEKKRILKARDILVSRMQYPPSLPDLAARVGISHARLTRGFKKVFGYTVFEYLRRERLEYAKMLLAQNEVSITQAAFEAGFCSSSHFAAAFSKQFGISPSAFRQGA